MQLLSSASLLLLVATAIGQLATGSPVAAGRESWRRAASSSGSIKVIVGSNSALTAYCSNGQYISYLDLTVQVSINDLTPQMPMQETGLPVVDAAFSVDGSPAQVTVQSSYNVNPSSASGNVWSFGLEDDQPSIGGAILLGPCNANSNPAPAILVSFSSKTFVQGQGVDDPPIPPVSGIPSFVNQIPGQTGAIVASPSSSPSPSPAVKTNTNSNTNSNAQAGSIVCYVSAVSALTAYCSNGQYISYLDLTVQVSVNGLTPQMPMQETGLPVVDAAFSIDGSPAQVTVQSSYNVNPSSASGNVWSFGLEDDQPSIGGAILLGPCNANSNPAPVILVSFSSKTFVQGQGVDDPPIPPVSGIPSFVNQIPGQTGATVSQTGTTASGANIGATATNTPTPKNSGTTVATVGSNIAPTPTASSSPMQQINATSGPIVAGAQSAGSPVHTSAIAVFTSVALTALIPVFLLM